MKTLKRLAACAWVASCGAACAQSQVTIYGTIDLAVGRYENQPPGPPNAPIESDKGVFNGGLQTSYIGFKGSEDLGGGLVARFQIESFLRADTGQTGRFDANPGSAADPFWSRESFVGIGGPFGELRLGNNVHVTWLSMLLTNALGSNSMFSPSFRQLFNGGTRGKVEIDTAMVNSVRYITPPNLGGFEASAEIQAGEGSGTGPNASANIVWRSGPLMVSGAVTRVRHAAYPNLAGARDQNVYLLGGAYDFGVVRLFAQYTALDNDRLDTQDKVPSLGLTAPLGSGVVQFSAAQDKTKSQSTGDATAKRTTTSLGYVYSLSKRTDLYTFVMNEKIRAYGPPVIAFDDSANSYVAGIRHRF